jgi:hypothetical protein
LTTHDDLPEIVLSKREILALFDIAITAEDFERADKLADLVLRPNDVEARP